MKTAGLREIRFELRWLEQRALHDIVPVIDGEPLLRLIDRFELAAGMKPAGDAYGGLIPAFCRFGSFEDHFLGKSTNATGSRTPVLGCECGEWGCWPLMVDIVSTGNLIVWSGFEQPYRPARDYSAFGPFLFDRKQYGQALGTLCVGVEAITE